jgi:hypothetical protein
MDHHRDLLLVDELGGLPQPRKKAAGRGVSFLETSNIVATVSAFPLVANTSLGRKVTLTEEYWLHIEFRHPEVGRDPNRCLQAVSNPDEIYRDKAGNFPSAEKGR